MLADVAPHVLPELGGKLSAAALGRLRQRGIDARLGTGIAKWILAHDKGGWPT